LRTPLAIAAALIALGACATQTPSSATPFALAGSSWQRSDDMDAGPHFPTIAFTADSASGFAGCNAWRAAIAADAQNLRFRAIAVAKLRRPPALLQTEQNFLSALERTRAYRLDGEDLVFLDASGAVAARFGCAGEVCPRGW
jgi:heat shock protein HslJ